jgi:hypothetical protein
MADPRQANLCGERPLWGGTVSSHGEEAVLQAAPPPNRDPLSALLRSADVQASSEGQPECQLTNANREQAGRPRPTPEAADVKGADKFHF